MFFEGIEKMTLGSDTIRLGLSHINQLFINFISGVFQSENSYQDNSRLFH